VDITVYLPDELGKRAKANDLNLSRMLRDAVTNDLARRDAVKDALSSTETYELDLIDREGRGYTGRIKGKLIAGAPGVSVYLTDDERVIVHDEDRSEYHELEDHPAEYLRNWFPRDPGAYAEACEALGVKAVIDL
jgi:hypothetical protein